MTLNRLTTRALARVSPSACDAHELALSEDAVYGMSTYLNDRASSVYAGSNEIQRNIVARSLLAGH